MAQSTDFIVDDGSGTALLAQLNSMFPALASSNSGPVAPTSPSAGMTWLDTGVSPAVLRVRNAANTAWNALGPETVPAKTLRGNSGGGAGAIADIDMATLKTMLGWSGSLATSGYQQMPSGLIVQWGSLSVSASGSSVTFPTTFPTACYAVTANHDGIIDVNVTVNAKTTSGFFIRAFNQGGSLIASACNYIAIGS